MRWDSSAFSIHSRLYPYLSHVLDLAAEIKHEAGRCVACGLCVPLCPTYRKTLDEAESPRGRVALMLALARDELPWSRKLQAHLDLCLACRACERACPSGVAYGRLYDLTRAYIARTYPAAAPPGLLPRALLHAVSDVQRLERLGRLLHCYQRSGLQRVLRASGLLRLAGLSELEANLPALARPERFETFYPAAGRRRGAVALFLGCIARLTDIQTLRAALRVLTRLGYDVHVPSGQGCCGALHRHVGETQTAAALMRTNLRAFGATPLEAIVVTSSGCAAMMREYAQWLEDEPAAVAFSERVEDISDFLTAYGALDGCTFAPLARRIVVHDPCTLANVLRRAGGPYALLGRIPGTDVAPLPENTLCCGAAGIYHLTEPEMAKRLRADKLAHLERLAPDILATSNAGCAMYLAAALREAGVEMEVVHPVVLLERQWRVASSQ